jgi:drug/metabolite transporter (DMT)-like permease
VPTTSLTPTLQRPTRTTLLGPRALLITGALCLSGSAIFVKLAEVNSGTAAFFRCVIALAALAPLAVWECRRHGPLNTALVGYALAGGACLGLDYSMWTASILDVGAGIATVLVNVQVLAFPLLARMFDGTTMSRQFLLASPVMLAGVALAGGALGSSAHAMHPLLGALLGIAAGVAYSGYLYLTRSALQAAPRHTITPVCLATAAAAVTAGVIAAATTGIEVTLPAASWGWLIALALLGQVAGWLLISAATPVLAPNTSATLLLLQPVAAVALALAILHETPASSQLAGCAVVIAAVWFANHRPRTTTTPPTTQNRTGNAH